MIEIIQRSLAINILCKKKMIGLSLDEKADLLLAWWSIDEDDIEFEHLPPPLQAKIKATDEPFDIDNIENEPLLLVALKSKYQGVLNEYIEKQLEIIEPSKKFKVEGKVEVLAACPCCDYLTLNSIGKYEICPVCFWEDTGSCNLDDYSSPNQMTLREAKRNFAILGAILLEETGFVDSEKFLKFTRLNRETTQ